MDAWLTTLLSSAPKDDAQRRAHADAGDRRQARRPLDFCYLTGDPASRRQITDMALCDADPRLMKHASPRQVAGGSLAENILKCQLKPLDLSDYSPATLTAEQLARLHGAFPDGVCDWSQPGVSQQPARSPLTFADGPGGKRLPPAPGTHGWPWND